MDSPVSDGLEEHLLTMFRDDVEFNENAVPSHLALRVNTVPVSEINLRILRLFGNRMQRRIKKFLFLSEEKLGETQKSCYGAWFYPG